MLATAKINLDKATVQQLFKAVFRVTNDIYDTLIEISDTLIEVNDTLIEVNDTLMGSQRVYPL